MRNEKLKLSTHEDVIAPNLNVSKSTVNASNPELSVQIFVNAKDARIITIDILEESQSTWMMKNNEQKCL